MNVTGVTQVIFPELDHLVHHCDCHRSQGSVFFRIFEMQVAILTF